MNIKFPFLKKLPFLDTYLGMELLDHIKTFIFNLKTNCQTVFQQKKGCPFRSHTSNALEFQLLNVLTDTWCGQFVVIIVLVVFSPSYSSITACRITILTYIFLMTKEIEHCFMCLFAICISSLVASLFQCTAHCFLFNCFSYHWLLRALFMF